VDARVTWDKDLQFVGVSDSGFPVRMDSKSSLQTGAGPVELTLMALAGCTAMDVIAILLKKRQQVSEFHVQARADRATDYPRVITAAVLEYVVSGRGIEEAALLRAIDLSVKQYCPVHAMLTKAFPISLKYSIFESNPDGGRKAVSQGTYSPGPLRDAEA
jgi:putative redox protein